MDNTDLLPVATTDPIAAEAAAANARAVATRAQVGILLASPGEAFLTMPELEAFFGVHKVTVYSWIQKKEFPAQVRLPGGRAVRWRASDLRSFLEARA